MCFSLSLQQLRGIFSSHDHDHDNMITRAQLVDILTMIGLKPTNKLVQKFVSARSRNAPASLIDVSTFLSVVAEELPTAQDVSSELLELFQVFDPVDAYGKRKGVVSLKIVRHIMLEALTPDRLSREEFEAFITEAGLKAEGYGMEDTVLIEYHKLINNLLIGREPMAMRVA